jgi:hypothetical protein
VKGSKDAAFLELPRGRPIIGLSISSLRTDLIARPEDWHVACKVATTMDGVEPPRKDMSDADLERVRAEVRASLERLHQTVERAELVLLAMHVGRGHGWCGDQVRRAS